MINYYLKEETLHMNPQQYYETNGYFVLKNLISAELINQLLNLYKKEIIQSRYPFFRQDTNKYEPNKINKFGHVKQAFLDIHDYQQFFEFSTSAKEIFSSKEIQEALKEVTGFSSFNLMQIMLFDSNTETTPHQDWWYLDSIPNGHLVGAWIALENIDERAGRFYVIPKSMNVNLHAEIPNLPRLEWKKRMEKYVEENRVQIKAPALSKGDVLFWNSRTIHGALPKIDESFSRKSLTAHYLLSEYKFGNLFTTKDYVEYKTYKGMNFYKNKPDYSLLNKLKFGVKASVYNHPRLLKILRKFQAKFLSN